MGNGNSNTPPSADLYAEIAKRKDWFFECQLRKLNLDAFRHVNEEGKWLGSGPDPLNNALLKLISEESFTSVPIGSELKKTTLVYLDSRQPVWTDEERAQHDAFAASLIGRMGDFLYQKRPMRLAAAINELKTAFEGTAFGSYFDENTKLNNYKRKNAWADGGEITHAISRMSIIQSKPWLIPELFNFKNEDSTGIENWIANGENFIKCFENEVRAVSGSVVNDKDTTLDNAGKEIYPVLINALWNTWQTTNPSKAVQVKFWDKPGDKYLANIQVKTKGIDYKPVGQLPFSNMVNYWLNCFKNPLLEVYVNKANSDMGLCHLMRTLYLFGTLPEGFLGTDDEIGRWRKREVTDEHFDAFFHNLANKLPADSPLKNRLDRVKWKLKDLLAQSKADPRSAAIGFSPIGQEILKQAILRYKFWLDEPFHAKDDKIGINKVREDFKIGDPLVEMEYWSENHYLMFCSSEYLAGQLWENETFQPAKEFLKPDQKDPGIMNGTKRRERGKARTLKWLNNKLLFGWTEFNSHGYYREHLFALMNLVDFALDKEVREKATVVMDLLWFDIMRFSHQGSMGAAGGRSQFKSKMGGRDNAGSDAIEILLGNRGIFLDAGGEVGCSMATSTYRIPAVLLEIGLHPPFQGFTDRSRVSVGFDDAPKYGIQYSQKSDQKDSLMEGFAPKRKKHFHALEVINDAITASHNDYGSVQDDTVFWWGMSAYYNKQIVRNTFDCIDKYGLSEVPIFKGFIPLLIETLIPLIEKFGAARIGANLLGTMFGSGLFGGTVSGATAGAVAGFFANKALGIDLEENTSDDLSIFLEGSTRSRGNIMSYRSRNFMLSSLQNFRPGQLNFQSSVNQATLSSEVNVFSTAAFPGLEMSALESGLLGGLAGASLGFFVPAAAGMVTAATTALGAGGAVLATELKRGENPIGDDEDGPGWWTGYWALPMVVQHEGAAILAYDFYKLQRMITRAGSHVWFPKQAFDQFDERRTSAYDDDNFALQDIFDIGRKGFWIFGKIVQPPNLENPLDVPESYIGVFSNQPYDCLNKDHYFYENKIKEHNETALEKKIDEEVDIREKLKKEYKTSYDTIIGAVLQSIIKNSNLYISKDEWVDLVVEDVMKPGSPVAGKDREIIKGLVDNNIQQIYHQIIWKNPLPTDFFVDKDWYVSGKNIWIHQVGSKDEYGSFDHFKEVVSKANVVIDDAGDMECTYHIPKGNGSSEILSLKYGDGGKFTLNGNPFQTDFYPRFENPFIRGGRVEWGQREYVIEHNGKFLMHDFSNLNDPKRCENEEVKPEDLDTIKALVIYIRTGDEDMDLFSVAQATVKVGCETLVADEVVAAGEVEEDTSHDAEWIFFDKPGLLAPDMTIEIKHTPVEALLNDRQWKMSFSLKALLGDRRLYDCSVSFPFYHFKDERRSTVPIPFSVQVYRWRSWQILEDSRRFDFWQIASQPGGKTFYYNYFDLLAIDANHRLWHRRVASCPGPEADWKAVGTTGTALLFKAPFSICSISTLPENLFVFALQNGELFHCFAWPGEDFSKKQWAKLTVETIPPIVIGIFDPNVAPAPVPVPLSSQTRFMAKGTADVMGALDLYLSGADHNFYSLAAWQPGSAKTWRKIATDAVFMPLAGAAFEAAADFMFVLDDRRRLWAGNIGHSDLDTTPDWKQISNDDLHINNFTVAHRGKVFKILVNGNQGEIWAANFVSAESPVVWERVGQGTNFHTFPEARLAWAVPRDGQLHIFATGSDGKVYSTSWKEQQGSEINIVDEKSHKFENPADAAVAVLSRVNSQLEVFTMGADHRLWKTWWT